MSVDIDVINIRSIPGANAQLIITISDKTGTDETLLLKDFLSKMELSFKKVIIRKESDKSIEPENYKGKWEKGESLYHSDPIFCFTDKSFPFSVNDADYWFSNVEDIYQGKVEKIIILIFLISIIQ